MTETELADYISTKSIEYLLETDEDCDAEKMPTSIVDFVIEEFMHRASFPQSYTEDDKFNGLSKFKNKMAMACVDIYRKIGVEGQTSYAINKSSRNYDSSWITQSLFDGLPNYVKVI